VIALDFGGVEEAGLAADQHTAREGQLGQGIQTALIDRTSAVDQALTTFQVMPDLGMGLPALEFLEGVQVRILVVQGDDIAAQDPVFIPMIKKPATLREGIHGPACTMHHETGLMLGRIDFPNFLEAYPVMLWITPFIELELSDQLFTEMASATFGKNGVLGMKLDTRLETRLVLTILGDTHGTCSHAFDRVVLVIQNLGGGKAREDVGTHAFGLFTQPTHQLTQADDVIALVAHRLGQ
jgi:hypothetical protein